MGSRGSPVVAIAAIDAKAPISNDSHIPLTKPDTYIQSHNQGWWQKTINNTLGLKKKGDACHQRSTLRRLKRRPIHRSQRKRPRTFDVVVGCQQLLQTVAVPDCGGEFHQSVVVDIKPL